MKSRLLITVLALALAGCGPAPRQRDGEQPTRSTFEPSPAELKAAAEDFEEIRRAFLPWYYQSHPVRATQLGVHEHDALLPALDRVGVQARIDELLDWLADVESVPFGLLEGDDRYDSAILEYALRAELLELEETRTWARDPRLYTATVASGISGLVMRAYAPAEERMAALTARLEAAPALLEAARANLTAPPMLWTEMALSDTRGLIRFLEEELPATVASVGGAGSAAWSPDLDAARNALVAALEEHAAWLQEDLLPRSGGEFRLGRYLFERKLMYEEHIALGVDEMDRLNEAAIARYRERIERVAAEIDPSRPVGQILDSLAGPPPTPESLLPAAREMMEALRAWSAESDVVDLPDGGPPTVREMPAYARSAIAYLDAPGPLSSGELASYFNITTGDPGWTEEQARAHLTFLGGPELLGVTIQETYPGRYVQVGYERDVESEIRRIFTARSFSEGWAHYAEEMVLDAGFRDGDPVARLGQLRRALERHARWYATLHLHAMDDAFDQVVRRYMEIAYLPEFPARRAVSRATYDPIYLYEALGRMQIHDLREDYQEYLAEEEEEFRLGEFHDRILSLALPLPLAREVLIPMESERQRRLQLIR